MIGNNTIYHQLFFVKSGFRRAVTGTVFLYETGSLPEGFPQKEAIGLDAKAGKNCIDGVVCNVLRRQPKQIPLTILEADKTMQDSP